MGRRLANMATVTSSVAGADTISIKRPDDFHLHLRDGAGLRSVVRHSADIFRRAVIMPNLRPPITKTAQVPVATALMGTSKPSGSMPVHLSYPDALQALEYKRSILEALPDGASFEPLMTLYLTDKTPPDEVEAAKRAGIVAFKLYPAGATTNSDSGVTNISNCIETLSAMAEVIYALLLHNCGQVAVMLNCALADDACSAGGHAFARAW